jgi:hypothetical protein
MAEIKTQKNTKTIRLYKDNDKYKDDVQVIVNGKVFIIQRGVDVEVPDYVEEVLDNAQKQAQYAIEVSDSTGKRE